MIRRNTIKAQGVATVVGSLSACKPKESGGRITVTVYGGVPPLEVFDAVVSNGTAQMGGWLNISENAYFKAR